MNNELCQDFLDWNFVPRGYLDYLCGNAASKSWRFVVLFCQIWPVYKERCLRLSDESRLIQFRDAFDVNKVLIRFIAKGRARLKFVNFMLN